MLIEPGIASKVTLKMSLCDMSCILICQRSR